jgi:hypothetical protein
MKLKAQKASYAKASWPFAFAKADAGDPRGLEGEARTRGRSAGGGSDVGRHDRKS